METKKCFKCNKVKPLSAYYKHPQMSDGHLNKCKECTKKDAHKHREENLEKIQEYDRKRGMLPHRIEARKLYSLTDNCKQSRKKSVQKYRVNNRIKQRASNKVAYYLKKGDIKKELCAICGSSNSQAHHPDYNYPLDVIWLCPKHHREEHNRMKEVIK